MQTLPECSTRAPLAITLGDPAGIGAEVILKALATPSFQQVPVVVVGERTALQQTYDAIHNRQGMAYVEQYLMHPNRLTVIEPEEQSAGTWQLGRPSAATGTASFRYLQTAISGTLAGHYAGIVTGPIAKSAWAMAGHHYPGQTELLAERAGVNRFGMLFVATSPFTQWQLRTLLATTHIPLQQVPTVLTPELLTLKLDLLVQTLQDWFRIEQPRIAVAGLNPHSGEQGQLGREEQDWLIPWLNRMGERYPQVELTGPVPPDTLWVQPGQAWYGRTDSASAICPHDAYLALYHDQGLIPVKLMAFDRAVNTTIGLPFVRTSPDHGTAFDLAGQGVADATSMGAAIALAQTLTALPVALPPLKGHLA